MKPYFETKLGKLYHGDCLNILPDIPKKNIDLVSTDPVWPGNKIKVFSHINPELLFSQYIDALAEFSIKRMAIHLGCDTDPRFLAFVQLPFFRICWLRYAFPHCKGRLLYSGDVVYLFGKPPKSRPGFRIVPGEKCATDNKGNRTGHPCSRKIEHVLWIIAKFSTKNELVLDPFFGSGQTGIACEKLGCRWIGIESEEKYCEIAARSIDVETKQGKLRF